MCCTIVVDAENLKRFQSAMLTSTMRAAIIDIVEVGSPFIPIFFGFIASSIFISGSTRRHSNDFREADFLLNRFWIWLVSNFERLIMMSRKIIWHDDP